MPTSTNLKVRNLREKRESLKSQPPLRRKSKRPHVLPANVTSEGQWSSGPAPQIKTSRMFLGMVALHLVAIAGLVTFHYYGHDGADSAPPNVTATTPPAEAAKASKPSSPTPATPPAAPRAVPIARTPAPAPIPVVSAEHYIVRMDESWESIANARGLSVEDLRNANPEVEFNVGRRLTIPAPPRVITAATDKRPDQKALTIQPPTTQGSAYNKYAQNPDNASLTAAAELQAPTKATHTTIGGPVKANATAPASTKTALTGRTYTVSKGETLFGIAKRRGLTEKALMKYNGITDASKLRIGQKIKLPATD